MPFADYALRDNPTCLITGPLSRRVHFTVNLLHFRCVVKLFGLVGPLGIFFFRNVFYKVSMPGESSYNWESAGGLPPPGSLTLDYSVNIPNSNNFSDGSDSATARAGNNQVGARATQFDIGSRSGAQVLAPEYFEDTPYVPPRTSQSLPDPFPTYTTHEHARTRTLAIPSVSIPFFMNFFQLFLFLLLQYPSPAESHHSIDSNWSNSSSSDQSQHDIVPQHSYTSHPLSQYQQITHLSRHSSQQRSHYPAYIGIQRVGLEHVHSQYTVQPPSAGGTDVRYQLPVHSAYQSDNVLAPDLYHDQMNQELGMLHQTQHSSSSLPSPRSSQQTFSVSPVTNEGSNHLLYEDAGPYLRETLRIPSYQDVNLWALPDPPEGEKPNQPYPILIKLAIYGSRNKQLTLQEIYTALEDRFQWFRERKREKAWKVRSRARYPYTTTHAYAQNSIRHNLSLNKVFKHVPRAVTEPGKGSYWQLDCSSGEGYKRARKRRSKSARAASAQDDDDFSEGDMEDLSMSAGSNRVANRPSPAASDDSYIDPELRQGSHVVGEGRTRSGSRRVGATSPYPVIGPSQQSPRYQAQILPHDSAPRFGQPSFGQASLGRPGFGQMQPRGHVSSGSSPSAFMSSSPATFGSLPTMSSRPGDAFMTQDRNAPIVQHTLRPGIVIQNQGGLPGARCVQSYPEAQSHSSQESLSSQRSGSGYSKGKGGAM